MRNVEEFHPADALNRAMERNAITFEKLACRETDRISARLDPAKRVNCTEKKENVCSKEIIRSKLLYIYWTIKLILIIIYIAESFGIFSRHFPIIITNYYIFYVFFQTRLNEECLKCYSSFRIRVLFAYILEFT